MDGLSRVVYKLKQSKLRVFATLYLFFFCTNIGMAESFDKGSLQKAWDLNYELDARFINSQKESISVLHGLAVGGKYLFQSDTRDLASLNLFLGLGERPTSRRFLNHYQDYFLVLNGARGNANFKVGRFTLPHGLSHSYDNHRRLAQNLYLQTTGINKDTGVSIFGYHDNFNYEIALTSGSGNLSFDSSGQKLLSSRFSIENPSSSYGVSFLLGESAKGAHDPYIEMEKNLSDVARVRKEFANIDMSRSFAEVSINFEAEYGRESGEIHYGFFSSIDFLSSEKSMASFVAKLFKSDIERELFQSSGIEAAFFILDGFDIRGQFLYFERRAGDKFHASQFFALSTVWRW